MTAIYEVFIRDEAGNRLGQIDSFNSLTMVRKFNAVGTWVLAADWDTLALVTQKGGIQVHRNGKPYFSGRSSGFSDANGLALTINGLDDLECIKRRLAYSVPSGNFTLTDYDVRSGAAESVIKAYINYNAGPGAILARQIAGLSIETDAGQGAQVTGRARFDKLLDLSQSLAIQGGVGFRIVDLQFQVYIPQDKTASIVFAQNLGTLGSYQSDIAMGDANTIIAGGIGSGSSRVFLESEDAQAVLDWGRAEAFLDKSNVSSSTELLAAIQEQLTKSSGKINLSFQPLSAERMRPIDDYDVGDWVTAIIQGKTIQQQVQEITVKLDSSGETITQAIGTNGATSDTSVVSQLYRSIRSVTRRVTTIERR